MNNFEKIYWLTRLDTINATVITLFVIATIFLAVRLFYLIFWYWIEREYGPNLPWGVHLGFWSVYLAIFASMVFLPTQKEAIIIYAGGKTLDFAQQDTSINKIPGQVTAFTSKFLQDQILQLEQEMKAADGAKEEKKEEQKKPQSDLEQLQKLLK